MKVFISHSTTDKWIARQIAAHLGERDIESFLDEKDIETGDPIDDAIQTHLKDCDELLMLLSPASLKSPWVLIEIGGAKALDKRLVPILLHVGPNDLPTPLVKGLARDLNDIERYYDEVTARSRGPEHERGELTIDERRILDGERSLSPSVRKVFSVGDWVRLPMEIPKSTYGRNGVDIGWADPMNEYLGAITEVVGDDPSVGSVQVAVDGGGWYWLMDWLHAVPAPERIVEDPQEGE